MMADDLRPANTAATAGDVVTDGDADAVLAARGRSFYWARQLLSAQHASRATRLYRFCRHLDDIADDSPDADAARQSLISIEHAIVQRQRSDLLVADALSLMQECGIDPAIMVALIDGVRSDLACVRIPDEARLLRYCYRVAGTVGLMMCRVLDVDDETAFRHAIDLGIAMQLTNICRDVHEDAAMGRRYLPASLVGDCEPDALQRPDQALRLKMAEAIAYLLDKAEAYYRSGEAGLIYLPPRARAAILVAARLYRAIGRRVHRRLPHLAIERTTVPASVKVGLTLQALTDCGIGRGNLSRRPSQPVRHDPFLHLPLVGLPLTAFAHASDPGA